VLNLPFYIKDFYVDVYTQKEVDLFNEAVKVKWEQMSSTPTGLLNHTVILLHGSVFVGGGFEGNSTTDDRHNYNLYVYNLSINHWSSITTAYAFYGMTVLNDRLVTVGGRARTVGVVTDRIFELRAGQWAYSYKMPTARKSVTAVGYQSMLIVIGGRQKIAGEWTAVTTTELLDTTTGVWYNCEELPVVYSAFKTVIVNEMLYLLGGYDEVEKKPSLKVLCAPLNNLKLSHKLKWQKLPDTPWCYSTPAVLHNNYLLTVGGRYLPNHAYKTSEVHVFNPLTGRWKQIAHIPAALSGPGVVSVADDKLIILGGGDKLKNYSRNVWIGEFYY